MAYVGLLFGFSPWASVCRLERDLMLHSALSSLFSRRSSIIRRAVAIEPMESRQLLSITPALVPVTISSAAKTADSQLANDKTFDLQVTLSTGDDWASGDLKLTLSGGTFYIPASSDSDHAQASSWSTKPNLQYDTFVTGPKFSTPLILGRSYLTGFGDPVFSSTQVDVAWGDLINTGAGIFTIARLTMSSGATGTVQGRVASITKPNNPTTFSFNLSGGSTTGSIAGVVYNDANGNTVRDSGEAGISGRTVYIDTNNNVILDAGEKSTTTDASGNYLLSGLVSGTYKVREIVPSGWAQTFPTLGYGLNVTLATGQNSVNNNFGVRQTSTGNTGSISGTVYNDTNGNGHFDTGEVGISGRTVYIDLDNDNTLDTNEVRVTTNSSGLYTLSNLAAGTYKVREVFVSGWTQTFPTNNYGIGVTLSTGQNVTGQNFFTKQTTSTNTASIAGNVFHDFDRDGFKDTGDTGLSGWTVYLDVDNDSILDSNEVRVLTDSSGNYKFSNLAAGTYKIRIVRPTGWVQTLPTLNYGNNATLTSGQAVTGKNFGADN
jgi:uncharacterized protein (DUF2141 family)